MCVGLYACHVMCVHVVRRSAALRLVPILRTERVLLAQGDTQKPALLSKTKEQKYQQERRFYHVSDDLLKHYDVALRTNMKAR